MSYRPAPQVFLKEGGNPWNATLDDGVVLQFLVSASIKGEYLIQQWVNSGDADEDAVFAQVLLDPTNPRDQVTIQDRIFAFILYGDRRRAFDCLPNAAAKADAADRHGRPNGELVEDANFCLGDDDFAWGWNAEYKGAISAGSGLSAVQDGQVALTTLTYTMDAVHDARAQWLEGRRRLGGQAWYNPDNVPGEQYQINLALDAWRTPSFT